MNTVQPPSILWTSYEDFTSSWDQYLEILEKVGRRQLRHIESDGFREYFLPVYNQAFAELRTDAYRKDLETAAIEALKDDENQVPVALLNLEMQAYVNWQTGQSLADATATHPPGIEDFSYIEPKGVETAHAVEVGKTIKDSLESLLGKWMSGGLRKILGVVNELLSIVRGGS